MKHVTVTRIYETTRWERDQRKNTRGDEWKSLVWFFGKGESDFRSLPLFWEIDGMYAVVAYGSYEFLRVSPRIHPTAHPGSRWGGRAEGWNSISHPNGF